MAIDISPELQSRLEQKAETEGLSVEAYVEGLIREHEDRTEETEEPLSNADPEFPSIRAAVAKGLEQAKQGKGRPAEDVFAELRATYGLPH